MRRFVLFSVTLFSLTAIHFEVSGQETKSKDTAKGATPPAAANPPAKPGNGATPVQRSADELAILQTGETFVKAFNQGNAKAVAEHYTNEAEYIDGSGSLTEGRAAIEDSLKGLFTANPNCKIELNIASIRVVGPGVAIEDGYTTVLRSKDAEPHTSRYTAVHNKSSGKWLIASVRESTIVPTRQHRMQLKQLDWMLGEWVHEGNDAVVFFSCELADKGNFLIRNFTVQISGQEAMSGSQRIGWDAQTGKLKAWIFDSDGGHSEGYWHRDGDSWVLKTTGVTADGQTASSTSIYSFVNEHTMTFQSVDHEVAGSEMPDGAKLKIVRHAPQPK